MDECSKLEGSLRKEVAAVGTLVGAWVKPFGGAATANGTWAFMVGRVACALPERPPGG